MENFKLFINKYHYGQNKGCIVCNILLTIILFIAAIFYSFVIKTKNLLYKIGILKEKKAKPFVICVGNLTTGGVGKTPLVCQIADYCTEVLNTKTAVISRGYGAQLDNKNVNVIKDDKKIHYDEGAICGDEALLVAKNTKNASVLTCRDRLKAANYAYEKLKTQIVILDDGFSNRKIYKDFIVLAIDSKKQFGNRFMLPLGPLREPIREIKRADFVIVVNKDLNSGNADKVSDELSKKYKIKNIDLCTFKAGSCYNIKNNLEIIPSNEKIGAFCAIGQPEQFYQYLERDFDVQFTQSFCDHHNYSGGDIKCLADKAYNLGISTLVTTQKDEVKIKNLIEAFDMNFISLKLSPEFKNERLFDAIKNKKERQSNET